MFSKNKAKSIYPYVTRPRGTYRIVRDNMSIIINPKQKWYYSKERNNQKLYYRMFNPKCSIYIRLSKGKFQQYFVEL